MMNENHDRLLQNELDQVQKSLRFLVQGIAFIDVASTNDVASAYEKEGAASGLVIMGARQNAGRGRLQRKWFTEEGDVAMSILLRPPMLPKNWALIPLLPAISLVKALKNLGLNVRLKWPNDIIIEKRVNEEPVLYFENFRKLGGILVENVFSENMLSACIIGIGLNIVPNPAIKKSVPHVGFIGDYAVNVRRENVITAFLSTFDQILSSIHEPNFSLNLIKFYEEHCETLGKDVFIFMPGKNFRGRAKGLDSTGALIVHDGQQEHVIRAGDVTFLRLTSPDPCLTEA